MKFGNDFGNIITSTINDIVSNIKNYTETSGKTSFTNILSKLKAHKDIKLDKMFDLDIWNETIELQKKLNEFIDSNWIERHYDWWIAIIDEETEILNSKHWKWWKDVSEQGKIDKENIEVELIDIFHFLLSLAIEKNKTDFLYLFISAKMNSKEEPDFDKIIEIVRKEIRFLSTMENLELYFLKWTDAWLKTGKDFEYLFKYYRVKSALNILRQTYGYKDGTYKKVWDNQGNEDNFYTWKFAEDMKLDKNMYTNLYKKLEEFYLTKVDES